MVEIIHLYGPLFNTRSGRIVIYKSLIRLKNSWCVINAYILQPSSGVNQMEQNENTYGTTGFVFICAKG